jgi:hypothetical protein
MDVDIIMFVKNKSKSLLPFLPIPEILADQSETQFQSGLQSLFSELDNPSPLTLGLISHPNERLYGIKTQTAEESC